VQVIHVPGDVQRMGIEQDSQQNDADEEGVKKIV
jgi:hypothetical protein